MSLQKRFNQQELDRIKAAVLEAESKISGEIVPVFVEKSGDYAIANYRGGLIAAALGFLIIIVLDRYVPSIPVYYDLLLILILVMLAGFAGALASHFILPLKKVLLSQDELDQATRKRAETAFLQEDVFNTRQRTGILIFVSFFEHEVIVMADRGISKVVEQKEWDNLVRVIVEHVKKGKIVDGMGVAIKRCGEILLEKGFLKTEDDVNELRDDLRGE